MSKRKSRKRETNAEAAVAVMRSAARREYVAALADGRRERAQTFKDRRREANRNACRGRFTSE